MLFYPQCNTFYEFIIITGNYELAQLEKSKKENQRTKNLRALDVLFANTSFLSPFTLLVRVADFGDKTQNQVMFNQAQLQITAEAWSQEFCLLLKLQKLAGMAFFFPPLQIYIYTLTYSFPFLFSFMEGPHSQQMEKASDLTEERATT